MRHDALLRRAAVIASVLAALVAAGLHPLDSDEGLLLNGSWNLLHGRALYEDTFEYVAPAGFYAVLAAWKAFGSTYFVARALAIAACAAAVALMFVAARRVAPQAATPVPAAVYFVALLALGPIVNHNVLFLLPAVGGLVLAMQGVQSGRRAPVLASGLLTGVAILTLQHKGAAMAAALAVGMALAPAAPGRPTAAARIPLFLAGALVPTLVLLRWPLEDVVFDLVLFPMRHYAGVQQTGVGWGVWFAAVIAWICAVALRRERSGAVVLVVAVQAALLVTALQRPDPYHLALAAWPAVVLYPVFAARYAPSRTRQTGSRVDLPRAMAAALTLGLPIAVLALFAQSVAAARDARAPLRRTVEAVKLHCGESVVLHAGPFLPGVYFETGKLSASRYSVLLTGFNTPAQFAQARDELERSRPACAVVQYELVRKFGYDRANPVEDLLSRQFAPVAAIGPVIVLKRTTQE